MQSVFYVLKLMQHTTDFHGLIFLEHLIEHIVILHRNPSHFLQHREAGVINRMAVWHFSQAFGRFINFIDEIVRGVRRRQSDRDIIDNVLKLLSRHRKIDYLIHYLSQPPFGHDRGDCPSLRCA